MQLKRNAIRDEQGHEIISDLEDGYRLLYLKLKGQKTRKLGEFYPASGTLHVFRNREKHLHFITQSYGFNYTLLTRLPNLKEVVIHEKGNGLYSVALGNLLSDGEFLFFKEQGFERQIFYPITKLRKL